MLFCYGVYPPDWDSISLSALFVYPDGTQQTQLLGTHTYLYTNSMSMDANIVDSDFRAKPPMKTAC
ncbi:MAG: hypothetical protein V8R27_03840 [Oscillospiraceae bacterium]